MNLTKLLSNILNIFFPTNRRNGASISQTMIRKAALVLLLSWANESFAINENDQLKKKQISFTLGTNYSYRKFNPPRWAQTYTDTSAINSINSEIENFKSHKNVLDSLDIPVIAKGFGVYVEEHFGTTCWLVLKTGLQYGIKEYTILPRYIPYNTYPYKAPDLFGTFIYPIIGIPMLIGVNYFKPSRKFQVNTTIGPIYNFQMGFVNFKTHQEQQKKFLKKYSTKQNLGYEDFYLKPDKGFFLKAPTKYRWQAQLSITYKIDRKYSIGFLFWGESTIFQEGNLTRGFYRKDSNRDFTVTYRRRNYTGSANINLGWSF